MSLINITNLTFAYDGSYDNIFENVSFQIDTDWKLGFTGRNGRGKTTFLNLLLEKYTYKGKISKSVNFEYFPFEIKDKTLDTIDIVNNLSGEYELWEFMKELSLLDVDDEVLWRPFNTLSNGEQTKVLIAALFIKENSFLLIDEPTNHLDTVARKNLSKYLKTKKGYILVSHDRTFLDGCVDHILSVNKSNIEIQKGNFSSWYYNKELQDNFELAENYKIKKEISRLSKTIKEKSDWSNKAESSKIGIDPRKVDNKHGYMPTQAAKSKKMMARSKAIEKRYNKNLEEKSGLLKNIEDKADLIVRPLDHFKNNLISFNNVSINYGEKIVCTNVNFDVQKHERVALHGKNGCGKSSILKLIIGDGISYTGSFIKASNLIVSYISQDTSFLKGNLSEYAYENKIDETIFKTNLRQLGFDRVQFEKDMEDFSGGQKKKVLIAKTLCEQAHLYVWDEPLNFIDVISRIQIEELIENYKPTLLFVEHDSAFSENISTKRIIL
ncbi:MAG: ABC-F type ribosomal protection protein [Clostridia bacterium]